VRRWEAASEPTLLIADGCVTHERDGEITAEETR
jgi:hypothetical protein